MFKSLKTIEILYELYEKRRGILLPTLDKINGALSIEYLRKTVSK